MLGCVVSQQLESHRLARHGLESPETGVLYFARVMHANKQSYCGPGWDVLKEKCSCYLLVKRAHCVQLPGHCIVMLITGILGDQLGAVEGGDIYLSASYCRLVCIKLHSNDYLCADFLGILNTMSAYHWEARRRQHALDRRRSNFEKVLKNTVPPPAHSSKQMTNFAEPSKPMPDKICKHCAQGTYYPPKTCDEDDYTAKLNGRYNSVQYSQQW
ncbi:uncharacterized protein LOC135057293 [Pseudophryne corroboree]|uniref:uncharacterized protein LOC135057293 n=1 Tax=Pseudophryne corroboree TaxID=495146 RepID=UPI00308158D8